MNYLPFVSWGMYRGANAAERANFFASWGLMQDLPDSGIIAVIRHRAMRLKMWLKQL